MEKEEYLRVVCDNIVKFASKKAKVSPKTEEKALEFVDFLFSDSENDSQKEDLAELQSAFPEACTPEMQEMIESQLGVIKNAIEQVIQFQSDLAESNQNAIMQVNAQLHSDKIERAFDCRLRWEKRLEEPDTESIESLRGNIEEYISDLKSDMKVRVKECNEVPKSKKMIFGWLEVRRIRRAIDELRETLPAYYNMVLLLSEMEIYLGKTVNAQKTIETAVETMKELFPSENRVFTLTSDTFWSEVPAQCIEQLNTYTDKIQQIRLEDVTTSIKRLEK